MAMYSYDQVLTDVRQVFEQLTGLPAPTIDVKNPRFPLPSGGDQAALIQSEINYLNLYLINTGLSLRLSKMPTWAPPCEVYETARDYVVCLEVAGLSEADVSCEVLQNTLVVRGARRFRRANEDSKYHVSARAYGAFERLFPLPEHIRSDALRTKFTDGILEIAIPKTETASRAEESRQ